ncbi:MAG: GNAT family N-acetyltransferase [Candidatus Solibacter usitatus]|nr:GNAT family N-acetyltransferase [Candidatus Solibacter usitatus]
MAVSTLAATARTGIIDLRQVTGDDLQPLLAEEENEWRTLLDWDFRASADLVVRFVNLQSLGGFALALDGEIAGYSYYIAEESKGLIGDVYVAARHRSVALENELLEATLCTLVGKERARRVESQLMMLSRPLQRAMPRQEKMRTFRRSFLALSGDPIPYAPGIAAGRVYLEPWRDEFQPEAARLITIAYQGHIDTNINDQYSSVDGCRRFLLNLILYPGCGRFHQSGSFLAFDQDTGQPCGLILSSIVGEDVAHVTQVCLLPDRKGCGFGYEMMRRAIAQLYEYGCRKITLAVTSSNADALRLYHRMGFHVQREFAAHVWEGL